MDKALCCVYKPIKMSCIHELMSADCVFVEQLYTLLKQASKSGHILTVAPKGCLGVRGNLANKAIDTSDRAVFNVCSLAGLVNEKQSLVSDIARYMFQMWCDSDFDFRTVYSELAYPKASIKRTKAIYDLEYYAFCAYLLSVCVCYVETDNGDGITKSVMTRNPELVHQLCNVDAGEVFSYGQALAPNMSTLRSDIISGFLLTLPGGGKKNLPNGLYGAFKYRYTVVVKSQNIVRIVPMFIMDSIRKTLYDLSSNSPIAITYIKDNGSLRNMVTTTSLWVMQSLYGIEHASDMHSVTESSQSRVDCYTRGYMVMPEMGLSKYDAGTRTIDIARILDIKPISSIDTHYIDIDFNMILPTFFNCCDFLVSFPEALYAIYGGIMNKSVPDGIAPAAVSAELKSWANTRKRIESTTFLCQLHDFMCKNSSFFHGYTGLRQESSNSDITMNLGTM